MEITGIWTNGERAEHYEQSIVDVLEMAHEDGYKYVSVKTLSEAIGAPINGALMILISKLQSTGIVVAFRCAGGRERVVVALYDTVDFDSVLVGTEIQESELL